MTCCVRCCSVRIFEEMIEPFRIHEDEIGEEKADGLKKECPWKITDDEMERSRDKVMVAGWMTCCCFIPFCLHFVVF